MSSPDITAAEIDAVVSVLRTPYLSIGPQIREFEDSVARYVGACHGVGVNSGTSGLHLAVIAAGVQEGDEVITPSFSFIASANCIMYERARPVFVDIDPQTGNMDPLAVGSSVTERTKAILAVHAFGQPMDMDPIRELARKRGLPIIEDACEALGAEYKGRKAGTLGDVAVFAFYPNKQMTTGEGGMMVTDDDAWAQLFRSLRNQGRDVFDAWLNHTRLGYNYRLDEMSAALGVVQLQRIEELLAKRARVAAWYNERLSAVEGVQQPHIAETTTKMSWFVYVVRCEDNINRDKLMTYLHEHGIPSRPYFTPIHLQPFYQEKFGWRRGDLPNTEKAGDTFLALPFSGVMDEQQVEYVCEQLRLGLADQASHHYVASSAGIPDK
jgi:dTDP-4-amino-4,6-dideoxygalactose transaminase